MIATATKAAKVFDWLRSPFKISAAKSEDQSKVEPGGFVCCLSFVSCDLLHFIFLTQLARATVRDPKTGILTVAHYRVSKR